MQGNRTCSEEGTGVFTINGINLTAAVFDGPLSRACPSDRGLRPCGDRSGG
ncbi:MAG: hypothetical protein LBD55_09955 [Treponema sp.]|nr:hypothetical protein [Treponema sp.]